MNNKVKKIHSTSTPKPARSYGGPATAGIEYDADRNTLILTPDPSTVKAPLRHSYPDTWAESMVLGGANAATAAFYDDQIRTPYGVTVVGVSVRFSVASSSGTVDVRWAPSGTAISGGTSVLSAPASTAGAANTDVNPALTGTVANLNIPAGASIGLVNGGTLTSLVNLVVTVTFRRTPDVA